MAEREFRPETRTLSLRATHLQLATWKAAAVTQGVSFNKWALSALDGQAAKESK
jgi:predicted HicB family RNase H-like nuclease